MSDRYAVFDFETLINTFTAGFKDYKTGKKKKFIIHGERNDFIAMMKFLRQLLDYNYALVGYNCLGFDGQIIEYMIHNYRDFMHMPTEELITYIYELSQTIINLPDEEKYLQLLPPWKLTHQYVDLYVQQHYNSKNKRTSLKWLQFTMRFPNIESMPVEHDEYLEEGQIPEVMSYMGNDIDSTHEFFKRIKFETDLRLKLSEEFDLSLINASEPRMARDIFGKFLSDALGMSYRDLKEQRTFRNRIYGKQIVFPYVKFTDPMLEAAKDFFLNLDFNPYNFEENSYNIKDVEKVFPFHNLREVVVGLGGLHACVQPGVYQEQEGLLIIEDIDVTSYYPNLGIENELFPQHLGRTFCHVYKDLFEMRQKIDKKNPVNYIYKIILNSAYGLSKEPNNYFHDPKYTFTITVNGQLLLLMLGEMLRDAIPGIVFYQFNTDGISCGYHPKYKEKVAKVKEEWQKLTRLKLENNFYKKMVIVDVNNYIAVDIKGKVKRKGLFGYSMNPEDKEMFYHKNPSELIVPKALEAYFVNGVPFEDYIMNSTDIYDFCSGVKVKKDFNLVEHSYNKEDNKIDKKILHQQVVRFYVTTEPTSLKKKYKPGSKMATKNAGKPAPKSKKQPKENGLVELKADWNTKYFNTYVKKEMKDYNLNYKYYIRAVRDIVDQVQPNSANLKLDL